MKKIKKENTKENLKETKVKKEPKEKKIKKVKKEPKEKKVKKVRDYDKLKRIMKAIMVICLILIVIEVISMVCMKMRNESKISFIDTLYSIENIDNEYYLAVGSSNFHNSRYNDSFTYEYEDGIIQGQINKVYAEQAKLVKLDKELNVIFEKTFKTDYDSTFYDVLKVEDGIIAVGSYVYNKDQLSVNTRDGLIAKYDFDGNFLWSKNLQVLGDTELKSIILLDDGFMVAGQSIYENMEIGNHPGGGGIIAKYDFDGNLVWRNNFGGNKSGIFEDIVKVEDGFIACGKDAANYGMLVKFDLEGNRLWVKNYEFTDTYGMYDMKVKDDKLYIATGLNVSDEKDDEGNLIYNYDAGILVYDLNGELLNKFSIGGENEDRFNSLMLLDDKIIAVGYTRSKDIKLKDLKYHENLSEGMIVEFNYDGKIINSKVYSGTKNEVINDVILGIPSTADKINNTNSYIMVGHSNSRRNLFSGNNKDYFAKVLKYDKNLKLELEK